MFCSEKLWRQYAAFQRRYYVSRNAKNARLAAFVAFYGEITYEVDIGGTDPYDVKGFR
jgi:hypothetical protein